MDLTPQVINEVEFSMARRGYDPDQVDEFLEKVAVAVGDLQDRITELRDRVGAAERRVAEAERRAAERPERVVQATGPSAAEVSAAAEAELETLKRTLLLAQRTADAAVREAEAEARRIVTEAETAARAAHESTLQSVLDEIAALESTRDSLRTDVESLESHMGAQRGRLQGAIADLQRILDEPARLQPAAPPIAVESEPPAEAAAPMGAAPPSEAPDLDVDLSAPFDATLPDEGDDDAWARFGSASDADVDAGPRTQPVLRLDRAEPAADDAGGDDAYLTELRKAMLEDTGAPDASEVGFFDEPETGRSPRGARFGRRR